MDKQEIFDKLDELSENLKDHNKFINVFSKDEGKKTLAKLYELTSKIKFLLKQQTLKDLKFPDEKFFIKKNPYQKSLVRIQPCDEKYNNKTYLGILIGEAATSTGIKILDDDTAQMIWGSHNPCIFVPELNEVIFGYESWWGEIKSEEEFKKITTEDIENTWYVKLLKDLISNNENEKAESEN